MQGKETKNLDHYATSEQGKAQTTVKSGLKNFSKKSRKESSQSRKRGAKAGAGKKQRRGTQQTVYDVERLRKLDERIQKLELEFAVMKLKQSRNLGG